MSSQSDNGSPVMPVEQAMEILQSLAFGGGGKNRWITVSLPPPGEELSRLKKALTAVGINIEEDGKEAHAFWDGHCRDKGGSTRRWPDRLALFHDALEKIWRAGVRNETLERWNEARQQSFRNGRGAGPCRA